MARRKPIVGFAAPPETDKQTLLSPISVVGGSTRPGDDTMLRRENEGVLRAFTRNPAAVLLDIRPKRSTSGSNDFVPWYLQDAQLYDLLDEMADRNLAIGGTEKLVVSQILSQEMYFEAVDPDDPRQEEARDFAERSLTSLTGRFGWFNFLFCSLLFARRHGFSAHEIVWKIEAGKLVPHTLLHRHPGQFGFDELGQAYLLSGPFSNKPVPTAKFAFACGMAPYGSPYGESEIYPLRWLYFFQKNGLKAWVDGVETYGLPVLIATLKAELDERDRRKAELVAALEALRRDSSLVIPEGIAINSVQRGYSGTSSPHEALIDYIDRAMVRYLSGSTLSSMENKDTGSLAQSLTHLRVSDDRRVPASKLLQDAVNEGVVGPLHSLNFGPAVPAPRFVINTERGIDVKLALDIYKSAKEVGVETSKAQYREWTGLEPPRDGEPEDVVEPGAPPAAMVPGADLDPEDDKDDDDSPDPEDDAEDQKAKASGSGAFAEFARSARKHARRRAVEQGAVRGLDVIAERLSDEARIATVSALREALGRVRETMSPTDPMTPGVGLIAAFKPAALPEGTLRAAVAASRALSIHSVRRQLGDRVARFDDETGIAADALAALPDYYRDAVRWMIDRKVVTRAEVPGLVRALMAATEGTDRAAAERTIRSQALALANSPSAVVTKRIGESIAANVRDGGTVGDFLRQMDGLVEAGSLPGGLDDYLTTVYRTETGNVYNAQREATIKDLGDMVWGKEFFNPDDDRSRETHAAMDGIIVKMGSPAELRSRPGPPWSYNCRCTYALILEGEGAEETPDAESTVAAIQRFGELHREGCCA